MNPLLFGKMDIYKHVENTGTAERQKTYFPLTIAFDQSEGHSSQTLKKVAQVCSKEQRETRCPGN